MINVKASRNLEDILNVLGLMDLPIFIKTDMWECALLGELTKNHAVTVEVFESEDGKDKLMDFYKDLLELQTSLGSKYNFENEILECYSDRLRNMLNDKSDNNSMLFWFNTKVVTYATVYNT